MTEPLARTMGGQITTRIRERILTGVYPPGSALLQDAIATEFGVSKIPVREALVRLRAEGLVNVFEHRGFQVRPVSAAEVAEVFRLRMRIEPDAVAEGAKLAELGDRKAVMAALAALNEAMGSGNLAEVGDLNCEFHLALVVPRSQPVAADILYRLHTLSRRYIRIHLLPAGRIRRAIREHNGLCEAWSRGKSREAGRLARAHIAEAHRELRKDVEETLRAR